MDREGFVHRLVEAVPEAFGERGDRDSHLSDPRPYVALGAARQWIEDEAVTVVGDPPKASVSPSREDPVRRFWGFVEGEAQAGRGDREMEELLQIECFEGVPWVEDLLAYIGPRTRELLADAQRWLAPYNSQVGRWPRRDE